MKRVHLNRHIFYFIGNLFLATVLVINFSCKTTKEISYTNLAENYKADANLHIDGVRIFHENDSISRVFLQYNTDGLKYLIPEGKNYFRANFSISYKLFPSYESNQMLSQQTFFLTDSLHYKNPAPVRFDFPLAAAFPGNYYLEVKFYDLNADQAALYPVQIEKSEKYSAQYFLPVDEFNTPILQDWISWKTKFGIRCADQSVQNLDVRYYYHDFQMAVPPFVQARPKVYSNEPLEEFTVELNEGMSENMQFAKEGFFFFSTAKNQESGLTLFRFEDYFPQVKRPEQLAEPLRYLTTNKEYEEIMNAENIKDAVDKFWLETAGNEERALVLIKTYYGRVEQANLLFSSHKEGWKTDRGMIYIIFGEPKTVYKSADIETWIYGEQGNRVYLTFDFVRAINPYSANDFELQRLPEYKEQWYNAVLFWRQ